MFDEYRTIVDSGCMLQIDCPDLAMSRNTRFADLTDTRVLDTARMHLDVLTASARLPREHVRLHLCWGNFEGPHNHDVPLGDIIDMVQAIRGRPLVRSGQSAPRARVASLQARVGAGRT